MTMFRKMVFYGHVLALLLTIGCERSEVILSGLSQKEANESLVLLRKHGIDAQKENEPAKKTPLFLIKVKREQTDQALNLLVDYRMPRIERAGLKDIYPPGASGLIPSKGEEHARFLMASQGEIEALFTVIPGIKDVRVVLSFDPPSELGKGVKKTASVVILYQDGAQPLSDTDARNLVASSVHGLLSDDVTVVQKTIGGIAHDQKRDPDMQLTISEEPASNYMVWYMLALTMLAIVVACYGVFRLFVQRRAHA